MSQRLQVVFDDAELEEIRQVARRKRQTVAEWVRQTLREARSQEPSRSVEDKLAALDRAVQHEFPSGDVDRMLAEIEAGYLGGR